MELEKAIYEIYAKLKKKKGNQTNSHSDALHLNPLRCPCKCHEGKSFSISIQRLYRPDKGFAGFFLLKSAFSQNIICCHIATLPMTGND